jgi:hypothetical protein
MGVIKRAARKQARRASVKCGTCGKRYTNPLAHVCKPKSDFKSRTRAAERDRKREAARERRKAAAGRRKAAAAARRAKAGTARSAPRTAHDYRTCRDGDCARHACAAYRDGYTDGQEDGRQS